MTKADSTKKTAPVEPAKETIKKVLPPEEMPKMTLPPSSTVMELAVAPAPVFPFDRWFAAKGYKERWKAGMVAFTDTSIPRTMTEWDEIFKKY